MFRKKSFLTLLLLILAVLTVFTACGGDDDGGNDDKPDEPPSAECQHESYGEWMEVKAPTCKETGLRTRKCNGCDKTESEAIAKVDHSFTVYTPDGNATCKDGTKTSSCDYECGATDTLADVGSGNGNHAGGTATCKEAARCATCGSPYGYKVDHSFETYHSNNDATCTADGTKTAYCKYGCGTPDTKTDEGSGGHKGGTATCTVKAKCMRCGQPYGELSGHNYVNYVNNNDATCGDGTETATCENPGCNEKHTRTIVGSGSGQHTGGTATCEFLKVCDVCNQPYGLPLQHRFENFVSNNDATCKDGTKTAKCENPGCNKTKTITDVGSAGNNHDYKLVSSTPVSCTSPATKTEKCSVCEKEQTVEIAPAMGHSLTEFVARSKTPVSGKACTYTVVLVGVCENCSATDAEVSKEEVIHNEKATVSKVATCVSAGEMTYKCQSCDAEAYTKPYTAPDAHKWVKDGDPVDDVQAYKCDNATCDATKSVIETSLSTHSTTGSKLALNELKLGTVSLKLDNATASQLGSNEVTVSAKELVGTERDTALNALSSEQKKVLDGKPLYDFTMMQSGGLVSEFDGKIKVTVPYQIGIGEDPACVVVWFIADDGKIEQISATYVDGYAIFETDHFSNYSVTTVKPEDACLVNGHDYREGANSVEPTCDTVGYTVLVCNRCGSSAAGQTLPALGHKYGSNPTTTAPDCYKTGKYVYTCTVSGCGHTQEIVRPVTHQFEYLDSKNANCREDGYYKEKCTECGFVKVITYLKDPENHNYVRDAALKDGATDCSQGVDIFTSCSVEGCDYYSHSYYINTHEPLRYHKENISDEIITEEIDISEYLPAEIRQMYSELSIVIRAEKAGCACGKAYFRVEIVENSSFGSVFGVSNYTIDAYTFVGGNFDTDPMYYQSMPMGPNSPTATIMLVNTVNKEGCIEYYGFEVHIDYDKNTETAAKVVSFMMCSAASHNTYQDIKLKYEGTKCDDGVIVTTICHDCGEVIGESVTTPNSNQHYYVNNSLPFVFDKEMSTLGHEAKFIVWTCACGSRKYELVAENCTFNKVAGTENEYSCSCGYRYKEVLKSEDGFYGCEKRTKQVVYYDYDSENGTYINSTVAIPGYVYTYHHQIKGITEYVNVRGCKVDYVYRYVCDCGRYEKYSWQNSGTTYKHKTVETVSVAPDGSVTTRLTCKECDYVFETVTDAEDNVKYRYYVIDDPDKDVLLSSTVRYIMLNGELYETFNRTEVYDSDGKLVEWQQTVCYYNSVANGSIYIVKYTFDSLGNSSFEELY